MDCDANGNCLCLDGYSGTNCEICSVGYYAFGGICTGQSNKLFVKIFCDCAPIFNLACECDAQGSSGCDITGKCLCHEGYTGTKCITLTEQCPDGWKPIGVKCYMASTEKATWEEANRTCSSLGGKLVEPMNSQEDSDVAAFMEERYGSQRYWIGLSDQVEESM